MLFFVFISMNCNFQAFHPSFRELDISFSKTIVRSNYNRAFPSVEGVPKRWSLVCQILRLIVIVDGDCLQDCRLEDGPGG